MTEKVPKVVSKLYRIQLTDDLKEMIQNLPVRRLEETQEGNHVYMGMGEVKVGGRHYPVQIRVWSEGGSLLAMVAAPGVGLELRGPFETPEQRQGFPTAVRRAMSLCLN